MPCSSETPEEARRDTEKQSQRRRDADEAFQLRLWLEKQFPEMEELTEVGKLCHFIRSLGEDEFVEVLKKNFNSKESHRLYVWWEDHKYDDMLQGR